MATIEDTILYKAFTRRASQIAAGPADLSDIFLRLRTLIQDTEKYIVLSFPEYTPHDHVRHLDALFGLADRLLGEAVYNRLGNAELVLLVFGLYTHDWGMALPLAGIQRLFSGDDSSNYRHATGGTKSRPSLCQRGCVRWCRRADSSERIPEENSRVEKRCAHQKVPRERQPRVR